MDAQEANAMPALRAAQQSSPWPFATLDHIQARNHLAAQMAVQRIAAQAQAERLQACLKAWRSAP